MQPLLDYINASAILTAIGANPNYADYAQIVQTYIDRLRNHQAPQNYDAVRHALDCLMIEADDPTFEDLRAIDGYIVELQFEMWAAYGTTFDVMPDEDTRELPAVGDDDLEIA